MYISFENLHIRHYFRLFTKVAVNVITQVFKFMNLNKNLHKCEYTAYENIDQLSYY